ncbi:hypothetical protein DL98DRAFT_425443 [Cadophora sp. DSE1049]|nr:hypothetical protein DL98DRAFT_425443 [Cadophora sp. DSE1049]
MPSYLPLPISLQKSYINRNSYPCNLILRTVSTYPSALTAYAKRLDFAASNLFERDVNRLEVLIRDLQTDDDLVVSESRSLLKSNMRFKELIGKDARPEDKVLGNPDKCFRSSLSAHLLFCYWLIEDWRGYIK